METVGYITTAIIVFFACIYAITMAASYFHKPAPPKLAGTAIPEFDEGIDIGKWYDIVYSVGDFGSQFVERL